MNGMNNYEKMFLTLFSTTARYHHRHQVFEDFISCSVIALQNRLSFCEKLLQEAGYSPFRHLWVSATDIDPLAAGMAYIQLSLSGVAGEVVIGNSLCDERRRVLLTPGHYMGNWPARLNMRIDEASL